MITGRSSGSGQYSYESRSDGNLTVYVSKMPEDMFTFRITFVHDGDPQGRTIKMSSREAQILWAALNATAQKFNWKDYENEPR